MKYVSTRGSAPALDFEEVVLAGLASDGGLYVPERLPSFSKVEIESWRELRYDQLAECLLEPFVAGAIPADDFQRMLSETYAEFRHPAVAPLVQIDKNDWVLELFHGPTLAFKDFALQLLGRLLDYILDRRGERVVIMGATSGDTGSAAIEGCRHCHNVDIFILHPHQRVSDVQRRQMTTVLADNVWNIAVQGNFDDCQNLVKASFRDQSFLQDGRKLVAVNSINWARIMAQIVYYVYAALAVGAPQRPVSFSVPTGNFGDIFAGYLAGQMGLPIEQLIIATNKNDVLHRIMTSGSYDRGDLHHTLSPSMDISISSNFERLMFDLYQRDGKQIANLMQQFDSGPIELNAAAMAQARELFSSASLDDTATCKLIGDIYQSCGYLLDPHSATGVGAAQQCRRDSAQTIISLATAHPAKFPEAVAKANVGISPSVPPHMQHIFTSEERYTVLANERAAINRFMAEQLGA
ncbi:MAG: threonine synthase [Pseudomonadales bacterium]|nr:threonine synthase [Pseudomonadales bacterium]